MMASPAPDQFYTDLLDDVDIMDVSSDSHAAATVRPVSLDLSSPLSSLQDATLSPRSSGSSDMDRNQNKRPAQAQATPQRPSKRITTEHSPAGYSTPGFDPNKIDFEITDADILNPANADATAVADFLSDMDKLIATPTEKRRTPRQNLQAFLIQQQLLAGIPVDRLEPMNGPGSRQAISPQGALRRFNTPPAMTVTPNATFIPHIPPAQFLGGVVPLPIHESLPNPSWMKKANENSGVNLSDPVTPTQNSVTSTESPKVNNPQTPDNTTGMSTYFSSVAEQAALTRFYAEHFSTGSDLLQQPVAAPADAKLDDDTEDEGLPSQPSKSESDTEIGLL
ncbi:uncharacterized protein N7498_010570 [Penicillium cinerascens]|uniref:Uncharacterized protein n=1 Tax=Penicillium cinerascens TaxID=70096 RepID=A0A9W9J758_9EURO|nr:uncharacterized protein N7498_010570 [Penicillium cinerascens]KAJ5191585.1 hypothetical protein N7498_010570 [Penicillium cinerascens]